MYDVTMEKNNKTHDEKKSYGLLFQNFCPVDKSIELVSLLDRLFPHTWLSTVI